VKVAELRKKREEVQKKREELRKEREELAAKKKREEGNFRLARAKELMSEAETQSTQEGSKTGCII